MCASCAATLRRNPNAGRRTRPTAEEKHARAQKYRDANREGLRANYQRWAETNPGRARANAQKWRAANLEQKRATDRKWREANPTRGIWANMKQRCLNPKDDKFKDYGGRGITVCREWLDSFEQFFADTGPRPELEYTLDRIDVNGNYEPGNVRWATKREQANNRRVTPHLTLDGETLPLTEWAIRLGLSSATIRGRINRGWPIERVFAPTQRHAVGIAA